MTESLEDTTLSIVFNQLQDVVITQKKFMDSLCSEDERREHEKTKALLESHLDKLQYALGEIEILTTQLTREKKLFESSFGRISERVKKESSKSQQLETKCTTIKAEKEKQEEILAFKDSKISELKKRLASQKENHQRHLEEVNIQMEQEAYISRNLATKQGQGRGRTQRNSSLR
ncbi:spermatogenesis-associated protein 24 isoform X2 [Strongylocentrotus purpuratus]|uniref:Spermatogenesis-associated protein 24 n=1 Tax=Strongylocentrotus purpuratus TaxID=7668 RepID=A0A7M7NU93_STRPU|nr:spermatogenesis-associated protein 24 isoform X2 [Strongylocentrotus purpuratus]